MQITVRVVVLPVSRRRVKNKRSNRRIGGEREREGRSAALAYIERYREKVPPYPGLEEEEEEGE